jgi:hypothetical protein
VQEINKKPERDINVYFRWLIVATVILTIFPIFFYLYKFGSFTFSTDQVDWGTFGEYFGGILNPLIAFLTLGVTVFIAITFNNYEKSRDKQTKDEADVKAYLELYQYFTSPDFREKRYTAWNVLRSAIKNDEYKKFLIGELFATRYDKRPPSSQLHTKFKDILYPDIPLEEKSFLRRESDDRHKLDSVVNFFQLLSIKDIPSDYHSICDFYYDSWRPLLYWYAKQIEKEYNSDNENKKFSNVPSHKKALELLDKKFFKPSDSSNILTIDNIENHPIIVRHLKSKK